MIMPNLNRATSTVLRGAIAALLFTPAIAQGQNLFESGSVRFSGSVSASAGFGGESYQLGIGAGYYVADGLELGLDARSWFGSRLNVHEVEPSITYAFAGFGGLRPYGGLFYRRTYVEEREDLSALGGRAGIFLQQSRNLVVRAGLAGIRYQDCEASVYSECSEFYPEVSVGFYF